MGSRGAAPIRGGRGRLGQTLVRSLVRILIRNYDRRVLLQLIEAAVGDNVSRIDAVNLRHTAVRNSRLYAAHMRDIVLDHIHERRLAILLNGGGRSEERRV